MARGAAEAHTAHSKVIGYFLALVNNVPLVHYVHVTRAQKTYVVFSMEIKIFLVSSSRFRANKCSDSHSDNTVVLHCYFDTHVITYYHCNALCYVITS